MKYNETSRMTLNKTRRDIGEISCFHGDEKKMTVFWIVEPCSLVQVYRRFRGAYCLYHQDDQEVNTSEMSVNFYQTTRRNIREDGHVHICR
jgi:hypothetical protein